jgi:hypothetical protein
MDPFSGSEVIGVACGKLLSAAITGSFAPSFVLGLGVTDGSSSTAVSLDSNSVYVWGLWGPRPMYAPDLLGSQPLGDKHLVQVACGLNSVAVLAGISPFILSVVPSLMAPGRGRLDRHLG